MKMKHGIAVAAAALLTLTACSGGDSADGAAAPAAEAEADETTKVLFISFTNDITEMAGQILEGMEIEFENAGFAVDIQTAAPAGAEDNEGFDRLLQDAITINPDYLMVLPASYDLVEDRLVEIQEAGIQTIVVNYFPGMLEKTPRIDPLTWITVNEKLMGEVGGKYMAEQYCAEGKSPNVVPFYGPIASEISIQRMGGSLDTMEEVLKACGQKLVVLEEIYADFNREKAFTFAENIATKYPVGKLDLIIGANSNTALGAMEALTGQNRLADVDILGMGGQLDELAAICRGDIKAAGFRDSLRMGSTIANTVMDTVAGKAVDKITLPPIPVVNDCETVFKELPELFWEFEGFRRNISDEMFNQYAK
ncbi:MAG: sugar ABC transporter substrate-binding protein [Actinomycetota bacterium]|nr:sugar ABC transporter substrate-binding protein [Actinomycetota bacterium]